MEYYFYLRLIHILSSTVLFGTGLGTALYMWRADRSGDVSIVAMVAKNVIFADWLFTTPAVIIKPLTGVLMIYLSGCPCSAHWLLVSMILYIFIGFCWIPVVFIQIKVAVLAEQASLDSNVLTTGVVM